MAGTGDLAAYVQLTTSAGSPEEARLIADALLEARLAACVQVVGPVQSRYWWRGMLESAEEWLCLVKTTAARSADAVAEIGRVHSYETPEITVTPIVDGAPAYLAWIAAEVRAPGGP